MKLCAAPCRVESSLRASRRGAARLDVIMLILVAVAALGMWVWVFFAYSALKEDAVVVSRLEGLASSMEPEFQATVSMAAQAFEPVGFVGQGGGIADVAKMDGRLAAANRHRPVRFVPNENALKDLTRREKISDTGVSFNADGSIRNITITNEAYAPNSVVKLVGLLDAQDRMINSLVDAIEGWRQIREAEDTKFGQAQTEYLARLVKFDTEEAKPHLGKLEAALTAKLNEFFTAQTAEADAKAELYRRLDASHETISVLRTSLQADREKVGPAADQAREAMGKAAQIASERAALQARLGGFKGHVIQVDPATNYVWISLGQLDNIRREMSFQVFAPTADKLSTVLIAEIRVRDVMGDHMSRCRIDFLRDDAVMPRQGDFLRNTSYANSPYLRYAFVGTFGGSNTTYSRQQLTDLLAGNGKLVQSQPGIDTEVLVLGNGYARDPNYTRLVADAVKFETVTERELLYMYGIVPPR